MFVLLLFYGSVVRVLANKGELTRRRALLESADPPSESARARRDVRFADLHRSARCDAGAG